MCQFEKYTYKNRQIGAIIYISTNYEFKSPIRNEKVRGSNPRCGSNREKTENQSLKMVDLRSFFCF